MVNSNNTKLTFQEMIEIKNRIQSEAAEALAKHFRNHNKAIFNMATGTGKTRTAWTVMFKGYLPYVKTVLFMVPKQSLVQQTIDEWRSLNIPFDYATVYTKGDTKTVEQLEAFMAEPTDNIKVVFAVYNSVGIGTDDNGQAQESIFSLSDTRFDLAIYDECHRTVGKDQGLFTSCVEDAVVKADKKLFMTATMKTYDVSEDDDHYELLSQFSMENRERYGKVVYSLPIAEAIRLGILCPFDTYLLEVSNERLRTMLKRKVDFLGETCKGRHLAAAYSVLNAYNMGSRKILVMFRQLDDARDFNNLFNYMQRELGLLKGAVIKNVASNVTPSQLNAPRHIRANDSLAARQWWLKEGPFTNANSAIATSSPWIKEGEDIPCIDTIVFGDRFNSGIDIIQIIGRALRWYDVKERARIILPVMEGEANKVARNIRSTVATMEANTEEFQIIRQEVSTSRNAQSEVIPEAEGDDTTDEPRTTEPERWAYQPGTTQTRVEFNQGEISINVIEDETFEDGSRVEHDQMLHNLSLKLTGNYNKFLKQERAKAWVNQVIRFVEEDSPKLTNRRKYKTNEEYYQSYASSKHITVEQAQEELQDYMYLIEENRNKVANSFFSFI